MATQEDLDQQTDSSEVMQDQSESVAATNLKVVGDGPAFYTNIGYANAVAHQQSMSQLTVAITAKATEMIMATNPSEGAAGIATMMQLIKAAQTTPPVTA